jgi:hypothetical protein
MRSITLIVLLLAVFVSPTVLAGDDKCTAFPQAVPFCAVVSDAANYDGREITVRGLYRMVVHGSILMGATCPKTKANVREAPDYKADKNASTVVRSLTKKDQFQAVDVVIRGTFRVAHQGQCFGQNCELYELENQELLCAQKPKSNARDADNLKP